jgi:hypothetical protein
MAEKRHLQTVQKARKTSGNLPLVLFVGMTEHPRIFPLSHSPGHRCILAVISEPGPRESDEACRGEVRLQLREFDKVSTDNVCGNHYIYPYTIVDIRACALRFCTMGKDVYG